MRSVDQIDQLRRLRELSTICKLLTIDGISQRVMVVVVVAIVGLWPLLGRFQCLTKYLSAVRSLVRLQSLNNTLTRKVF